MTDAADAKRATLNRSRVAVCRPRGVLAARLLAAIAALLVASGGSAIAAPQETKLVGKLPQNFKDLSKPAAALVGFNVTIGQSKPWEMVVTSLEPKYLTPDGNLSVGRKIGKGSSNSIQVLARDGYAVGAIVAKAADQLNGFRIVFMRKKGDRLDPSDSYESRWFGGLDGDAETRLGGDGRPIVGILGCHGDRVGSLGLIQDELPKADGDKPGPATPPTTKNNVVYLERSRIFFPTAKHRWCNDLLSEELMRQAFLLAAREELGLVTRDARLGDAMPTDGDNAPWEISVPPSQAPLIETLQGFYPRQTAMARRELNIFATDIDYLDLSIQLERQSRDFFADTLRHAGFQGKQPVVPAQATVSDAIAAMLEEMTFVPQFEAVRKLHDLIRTRGESPQLVGALVRGYANLGILTERHAHPAHNTFKARALLYAQRAVVREKRSVGSLQHRAYALAAASLNGAALKDLAAADELAKKNKPKGSDSKTIENPAWVKIIDAYCRYDLKTLESLEKEKHFSTLAAVLSFRDLEMTDCDEMAIEKADQILKTKPECCRVIDGLSTMGGVGLLHRSTLIGIAAVRKTLYEQLAAISDLPAPAAAFAKERAKVTDEAADRVDVADEFKARARMVAALVEPQTKPAEALAEKDPTKPAATPEIGEPSWAALSGLIKEQAFMQAWRRVHFESYAWGVSPNRTLAAVAPILAVHPYGALVESAGWDNAARADALRRLSKIPAADFEVHYCRLMGKVFKAAPKACQRLLAAGAVHTSQTERGFLEMMPILSVKEGVEFARCTLDVSPYSPYAKSILITNDWDNVKDRAVEWERMGEQFPAILQSLGTHYEAAGRFEDCERCLRAAVDAMPTYGGYLALANAYKKQNKMELWKSTLEEYLNHPDYGLSHAQVCNDIAHYHMGRREWDKAMPYAEGAAECYSAWGLLTAARCHEALRHWKEAESLCKAVSERYSGDNRCNWYLFCIRTGHGDIKAARHFMLSSMTPDVEQPADDVQTNGILMAVYYLLENDREKAPPALDRAFQATGEPTIGILASMAYGELKNDAKALAIMRQIKTRGPEQNRTAGMVAQTIALAALLAADLEKGGKCDIDVAANPLVKEADAVKNGSFFYCLGEYLSTHGKPGEAIACWKKAATYTFAKTELSSALAHVALRRHGADLDVDPTPPATKPASGESKPKTAPAKK